MLFVLRLNKLVENVLSEPRITKWINDLKFYFRSKTNKTLLNQNNGLLLRNKNWANNYLAWKLNTEHTEVLKYINNAYQQHLNNQFYPDIIFLDIPQSTGFRIIFGKKIPQQNTSFLFEYLKDACLQNGQYYLAHYSSEKQADESILHLYYLKPQYGFNEHNQQIQRFGNIMIELSIRNNRAKFIKLVRNLYSGRNYETAYDFSDLLSTITHTK